jgi:hypothetical protein
MHRHCSIPFDGFISDREQDDHRSPSVHILLLRRLYLGRLLCLPMPDWRGRTDDAMSQVPEPPLPATPPLWSIAEATPSIMLRCYIAVLLDYPIAEVARAWRMTPSDVLARAGQGRRSIPCEEGNEARAIINRARAIAENTKPKDSPK